MDEIGSCQAILAGVSTKVDGSVKITLEINPSESEVAKELLQRYLDDKKLFQVGFVGISYGG